MRLWLLCVAISCEGMLLPAFTTPGTLEGDEEPVVAPVVYEDLMLILSGREGVAAIVFFNAFDNSADEKVDAGVHYKYKFLQAGKEKVLEGEGRLFEKYKVKKVEGSKKAEIVEKSAQVKLSAGPLEVRWFHAEKGKGWISYAPERVRVQVGHSDHFSEVKLKRFQWMQDRK